MRRLLRDIQGARKKFCGVYVRKGTKTGWKGCILPTILLKDITDETGKVMCDHLWFNLTKGFQHLHLIDGVVIEFEARVKEYQKGYNGYREDVFAPCSVDYKLSNPTKLKVREN